MIERSRLSVEYTQQSLKNAVEIISYLRRKFSKKEVIQFRELLVRFENIVSLFPELYKESPTVKIRQAVLSKVLSVYYRIESDKIIVIAILDNRWDSTERID